MSRWMVLTLGLVIWVVGMPLAHGVVPWAISLLALRHGWIEGRPGIWNLLGLIPVSAGIALLIWIFVTGVRNVHRMPERLEGLGAPYLLTTGPYAFTRNPIYLAEQALWIGWSLFYGSVPVFITIAALSMLVGPFAVAREERTLEARFGETYLQYKRTVPRWFGKTRREE
jgi:protein-S-isoprenylcysteine O-methyltransferase Ste14